jgi:hypothetical protein
VPLNLRLARLFDHREFAIARRLRIQQWWHRRYVVLFLIIGAIARRVIHRLSHRPLRQRDWDDDIKDLLRRA